MFSISFVVDMKGAYDQTLQYKAITLSFSLSLVNSFVNANVNAIHLLTS